MKSNLNLDKSQEVVSQSKTWCCETKNSVIYNHYIILSTLCDSTQTLWCLYRRTHTHTHIWLISSSAEKCSFVLQTSREEQIFERWTETTVHASESVKRLRLKYIFESSRVRSVCA